VTRANKLETTGADRSPGGEEDGLRVEYHCVFPTGKERHDHDSNGEREVVRVNCSISAQAAV